MRLLLASAVASPGPRPPDYIESDLIPFVRVMSRSSILSILSFISFSSSLSTTLCASSSNTLTSTAADVSAVSSGSSFSVPRPNSLASGLVIPPGPEVLDGDVLRSEIFRRLSAAGAGTFLDGVWPDSEVEEAGMGGVPTAPDGATEVEVDAPG